MKENKENNNNNNQKAKIENNRKLPGFIKVSNVNFWFRF